MSHNLGHSDSIHIDELLYSVGVGTWDWNLTNNEVIYSEAWANLLGYTSAELPPVVETWEQLVLPEDLDAANHEIELHISGQKPMYESEFRMVCKDGSIIWLQDRGHITDYAADGTPLRFMGVLQNVTRLKQSEHELTNALAALEQSNLLLESKVAGRTRELVEQDTMLWTVNQISRMLLTVQVDDDFKDVVQDCLRLLGECTHHSRVYIWKDYVDEDDGVYCALRYEWVHGVPRIKDSPKLAKIPYDFLPTFAQAIDAGYCLNSLVCTLSKSELTVLEPMGVKTILIAPITINGKRWGFIGIDNCDTEKLFSRIEENMLLMSGSMIASMIDKMDTEKRLREVEERTQMMLDATPLCCNLWTTDFVNMSCNEEAVRLFGLSSQVEYLQRFAELSPTLQPNGSNSGELALRYIRQAFKEGYCRFEWMHQKPDGTPIPSEITLVRVKYRDSFIVAGYTRDLREFKAMLAELQSKENDLRAARDEALQSSKAKSNFLANMSHEIRTPMNAISGLAEIILRESADRQTAEYANGIKNACNNLLNIINDILDISKIESGKLEIFSSQYELASVLNDVITISRMRLGNKPLMFITDIDSRLPAQLVGDEIRIKQVLINLLGNAIKFTNEGHIALRVSGTVEGNCTTLRFSVSDSGTGIKPEDIARLFDQFERVNTTKNRSVEGTGLGLAISKQLCEMMGGQIEVSSVYGEGSVFTATIPQQCPLYERLAQVKGSKSVLLYEPRELYRCSIAKSLENLGCHCVPCANQSDLFSNVISARYDYLLTAALHLQKVKLVLQKNGLSMPIAVFSDYSSQMSDTDACSILFPVSCLQLADLLNGRLGSNDFSARHTSSINFAAPSARVLVVDDNPVNLSVAEGLMSPYLFAIDSASNGLEAVEMVQKAQYDLVFMDHMMPVMDGIDATVAIRQLPGDYYKNLPIIALTANALVGTRETFIREGMNDFLAKPIETGKLGHLLAKWLPPSKIVSIDPKLEITTTSEAIPLDLPGIDTVQGVMSVGGSSEKYLQILASFYLDGNRKCISLLHHLSDKDIKAFCTEVHAVKSTAATIGAMELSSMAAKLEMAAQAQDIEYIDRHIDLFMSTFKSILESMIPVLPADNAATDDSTTAKRKKGDLAYLESKLDVLHDAAELANIKRIERLMDELERFSWPAPINKELAEIRECLAVFDYDGVVKSVDRLRDI